MTDRFCEITRVLRGFESLRQALVFGSLAAGKPGPDSDVDVAVEADRRLSATDKMAIMGALAAATGRPVDLVDLKEVGEPLLGQILAHGQRLFGSDSDYAALISRHLIEAEDFLPLAERIVAERLRAWTD